jgi:hypothetical protein
VSSRIVTVIGNPRPASRTHMLARTLVVELAQVLGSEPPVDVDLAELGGAVLDPGDRPRASRRSVRHARTRAVPARASRR